MRLYRKQYAFNGLAGCVVQKRSRITGALVGVYNSEQAGLEDDPSCAWMTVCESHGTLVGHASLRLARDHSADPEGWCQFCRARNNTYVIDDEPQDVFSLNDFLKNNEGLSEGDKENILALEVGGSVTFGGGAAAEFVVRRMS